MIDTIEKYIYGALLPVFFVISLIIRVFLPWDSVFTSLPPDFPKIVSFGGNDPWYHMRLVELTVRHFPHRLMFDPLTEFPYGTHIHFGPLMDQIIAAISLIVGFGSPDTYTIHAVGAIFPAVIGALMVFPTYYLGKTIFRKEVGLISAALITVLPGTFLQRSLLGFTDHHIMEVLLCTCTFLFFILALKEGEEKKINLKNISLPEARRFLIFSAMAGLFLGLYELTWIGTPIFVMLILIFASIYFTVTHIKNRDNAHLMISGVIMLVIAFLMILPYFDPFYGFKSGMYAYFELAVFLGGATVFLYFGLLSSFVQKGIKKYQKLTYVILTWGVAPISLWALPRLSPSLSDYIRQALGGIFSMGGKVSMYLFGLDEQGTQTIAENIGLFSRGFLPTMIGNYSILFFLAFVALLMIGYRVLKEWKVDETFLLIWAVMLLIMLTAHLRYMYYFSVIVAILGAFFVYRAIKLILGDNIYSMVKRDGERVKVFNPRKVKSSQIITIAIIFLFIFYFPANSAISNAKVAAGGGELLGSGWYESLIWLKNNTPDTGLDYYELYEDPHGSFDYSKYPNSYGVMSWWDYGHWITTVAHRIPNANPFQHGIGGPGPNGTVISGSSTYFINVNEENANEMLDELGTRYVISDFMMADQWNAYYNKYHAMVTWAGRNPDYYHTMEARLHMFDGSQSIVENEAIPALKHYRLVYESDRFVIPFMVIENNTQRLWLWRAEVKYNYPEAKSFSDLTHQGVSSNFANTPVIIFTPEYLSPVSYIKIFEYVQGANIVTDAKTGITTANLSIDVTTNQGRTFTYTQTAESKDGKFTFTAPYSTEGPKEGGTQFVTNATSLYRVSVGGATKEVAVTEDQVMNGETLMVYI